MKTFNEFTQLNEVSKKLALAVASKRVKQGMAHRLAQSKVNPNSSAGDKRLYKSLGDRADTLHTKAQKSHEYAFRKGVVSEEHLAPGTSVSFPHNGKMKKGKVVGFRPGTGHTSSTQYGPDSYVIYHGEAESAIVPHHKVVKEEVQRDVQE